MDASKRTFIVPKFCTVDELNILCIEKIRITNSKLIAHFGAIFTARGKI